MPIYLPKRIVQMTPTMEAPLFFIAGPVRGGGDWQREFIRAIIARSPTANIACPCRWGADHPLHHYFHEPFSQAPNRQLHWERHYMEQAAIRYGPGCVIFDLQLESKQSPHPGPEPYAMDTRRELGKFTALLKLKRARMVVGGHPDFHGLSVIRDELDEAYGKPFPFYTNAEDLVSADFVAAQQCRFD